MADLYDVVFLGIDAESSDQEASIKNIAKFLELDRREIERLVEEKLTATVKQAVPVAEARKVQKEILRLGGVCNYRPAVALDASFELAPIEEEGVAGGMFTCPACGYQQKLAGEAIHVCPQCGLILSKYGKVKALKDERDRIRKRLMREQKARQESEMETWRRQMEEKIRKELGLPKALNSRSKLAGSAALLWLLGISMGGGLSFYYQGHHLTQAAGGVYNPAAEFFLRDNDPKLSPQQNTLQQIMALSRSRNAYQHPTVAQGDDSYEPVDGRPVSIQRQGGTGAAASSAKMARAGEAAEMSRSARLDANLLWQAVADDREWNLFLAAQSRRQTAAQQPGKAYRIADAISSPVLKMQTLGYLLNYFRNTKNTAEADNLVNLMANYANALPDIEDRIDGLGVLALALSRGGEVEKSQQYLESAEKLVLILEDPAANAQALARVATYQTLVGKQAQADANFRRVNTLIQSLKDKAAPLRVYIKLASSYAESGNRVVAMAILAEVLNMADQIEDKLEKSRLFEGISDAFVKLGDAESALALADRLDSALKDKALYTTACELAYTNRLYDAMKILDKIEAPENKARAAALVSRLQRVHSDMAGLSASVQEKALALQGQILNPLDQAIVRGETARYLAHAGQTQIAEEWAKKAMSSAQVIDQQQDRDTAAALLAVNLARANQPKLANETLALIAAPGLADDAGKEAAKIGKLFDEI